MSSEDGSTKSDTNKVEGGGHNAVQGRNNNVHQGDILFYIPKLLLFYIPKLLLGEPREVHDSSFKSKSRPIKLLWLISIILTAFLTHLKYKQSILRYQQTLTKYQQSYISKQDLYYLSGLREIRKDSMFQDFAPRNEEENHVNVISWLWADPFRKSDIKAFVISNKKQEKHENYLRITFDNQGRGWSPNVAIRPKGEKAFGVLANFNYLKFNVRIPKNGEGVVPAEKGGKLMIAVRVIDRSLTHWKYEQHPGHKIFFEVDPQKDWQTYFIDLKDKLKWTAFEPDGNYKYSRASPDFSVITAVVIEMGAEGENGPAGGYGTIDLANIELVRDKN